MDMLQQHSFYEKNVTNIKGERCKGGGKKKDDDDHKHYVGGGLKGTRWWTRRKQKSTRGTQTLGMKEKKR